MRETHKALDKRMFDFEAYYQGVATRMPNDAVIAECGIAEGASAIFLAEALLNQGKEFTFYLIDNMAYGQDRQLRTVMKNVTDASLGGRCEIIPLSSVEAACRFPDRHFDFVFIDASHKTEETKADITLWYQKLKVGGWLAGHDYNGQEGKEVKIAVDMMLPKYSFDIIPTTNELNVWTVRKTDQLKIQTF